MSEPDQLPALPESEYLLARPARPYENEYITSFDGYSDDDMRSYALTAIVAERARADALEAALREVLLAQENYARCHAREVNAINNYSGGQAEYSSATLKATVRVSEAERAARALLEKKT